MICAPYSTGSVLSSPPTEGIFWVFSCFPSVRSQHTFVFCLAPVQDRFHLHFLNLEMFVFSFLSRCSLRPITGSIWNGFDVKNCGDFISGTFTFVFQIQVKLYFCTSRRRMVEWRCIPHILNLGSRWKPVVALTLPPLNRQGKHSLHTLHRRLGAPWLGPRAGLNGVRDR